MFRIRQVGNGYAVYGLQSDIGVIFLPAVQAADHRVFRHGIPEFQGRFDTAGTLIIGVIVGDAEYPGTLHRTDRGPSDRE